MRRNLFFTAGLFILICASPLQAAQVFGQGSTWRWRPGASEASTPVTDWRLAGFNDSEFTTAPAPFWYDTTGDSSTLSGGTQITGMQNVYSCLFFRKTIVITNVSEIGGLRLGALVDDGFVAWINGTEVLRVNMSDPPGSAVSTSTLAVNAVEPVAFLTYDLPAPSSYLVPGTNVIAVQVFQSSLNSSDVGFECSLESIVSETVPPTISSVSPAPGTIFGLGQITVTFSEPVSGVNASDLLINGVGTTQATPVDSSTYTFSFPQPAYGNVAITWASAHGITDQALPANAFDATAPGATWQYTLLDNTPPLVSSLSPASGATVRTLTGITVSFNEPVQGVDAADLLINSTPASGLTAISSSQYTFTFSQPGTGTVQVAWASAHGIRDLATTPNAFSGGSWTYQLNPNAEVLPPYISEFMASNSRTLVDENNDYSDWIEIYNPSSLTVNLDGWYLTDSANNLTQWRFPATNLAGGGFLVVFASGKDRRVPGARLHTSFRLSNSGEYLALVKPDGATIASEFAPAFPSQVPDVSYGYAQFGDPPFLTAGTNGLYFTVSTPGAPNIGGANAPGPAIRDVKHTPNVPLDNDDLIVTARVFPSFYAVSGVTMRYRVMFDNEVQVTMFDDGNHGDGAAGDGIFGATIPASASTNGQMVRYFIAATDVNGRASRWPLFPTPTNSAQYLGTVVNPNYVTSSIPVIQLFALPTILQPGPNTSAIGADSQAGSSGVSLYYDGEFYDNIYVSLRGNTTAGYPKKSHRLEFNREHLFRHPGAGFGIPDQPAPRIRRTSFEADFPDPSYMRQGMAFWLCQQMGSPSSFYYPVRLQLNGQFYQLANHNDVQTEELLDRLGYDPNGALYNAAGTVQSSQFSTGGFEKKTRTWEGNADYTLLANSIVETLNVGTRRTNAFDMLDLPNIINYLVCARFVQENDDVWANMSLYHDNDGDNLWRIIAFDMNLSWGAFYFDNAANDAGIQATNDNHKSFPLYGSASALSLTSGNFNRIYDIIFQVPQTREMFLRRMRTLLDTYVLPANSPINASAVERKLTTWRDLIMVDGATDRAKWGWPAIGGQNNLPPGTNVFFGVKDILEQFFYLRRQHFYGKHSAANTALSIGITKTQNAGIPLPQPANAYVAVISVEAKPSSGDQSQEYVCLTNPAPFALEISGWKLEGAVEFTFAPGTVIPSSSAFYVSPNVRAFKGRTVPPRGGQGLFVLGPYKGQLSARGETIRVRNGLGNIVNTFTYAGAPSLAQQFLRISEVMYNPAARAGDTFLPDEYEYIELKNISTNVTLNLSGIRFTNGISFDFTGTIGSLAPGARVLVVKNSAAFNARYGGSLAVAGQYVGSLDNDGERIQLIDANGEEILDFSYKDGWYPITDGLGFALVVADEQAQPDAWDSQSNWRSGSQLGGSPGAIDPAPPVIPPILINEILSRTDTPPPTDSIELFNPTAGAATVGGWWITDDFNTPKKFRIPDGTTIAAGGYRVFTEADFNPGGAGFAFSSDGDEAWIFSADAAGNLTGYSHGSHFGAADDGISFGRYLTSVGEEHFVAQRTRTLGAANAGPRVGPVVINEIMYRPPDVDGTNDNSADEFIELLNISESAVQLYDPLAPIDTWEITGNVDFVFPLNITLAAGEYALVANFNPTNAAALAAFRAKYGVAPSVKIFGPYGGKLDNSGGDVELKKPTTPLAGNVPYVLIDKVSYRDSTPWPAGADGYGLSLQRRVAAAYGNDPSNWTAAPATAAGATVTGAQPVTTSHPQGQTVIAGTNLTLNVSASGPSLRYQWRLNGINITGGTNSLLQLSNIRAEQAGDYNVLVFNSAGSVVSSNATVSVVLPASILQQPQSLLVRVGSNVTFTVVAYSTSPLRYQWQKDGVNLLNATNSSLVINNAQIASGGSYTVIITDDIGSTTSDPAILSFLIAPDFILSPVSQSVVVGSPVTLSWAVTNGATLPLGYRLRINNVLQGAGYLPYNARSGFFTVTNTQANLTNYAVAVTNAAGSRLSASAILTFLTDSDGDGIPDAWEAAYGFNTNSLADATQDADGDTMSNLAEYIAGTDPRDRFSYLKVERPAGLPTSANVSFIAVSNRTYTVEYTDALGTTPWQRLADVSARTTTRTETVVDPAATSNRYYRLVTPRRP